MVLPDFQRDFVWEPYATQELIVSIANNYPAGSLLRVRDVQRVFAAREFEGAPALNGYPHVFLVLDGQQRLTSLYQAFYGVGEHRYYLRLKELLDGQDFDEAIFHVRATTKYAKQLENFELQAREQILPLSVLKGGAGGFLQWLLQVTNPMPAEQRTTLLDALTRINENWIKVIDDYHFPVVTLSSKSSPAALCTIFETLNRTGVKLSVFELLTARFWPVNINLRELWDNAKEDYPIIKEFEIDPYYVLQAIALACLRTPSCRRGDVLELEPENIRDWWRPVVAGMAAGLSILREDCKVMLPKWLPYQTMVPPLAAILARSGSAVTPAAGVVREKIQRWFWSAVFGQVYESAANSKSAKDVTEVLDWIGGGPEPESVRDLTFDPKILRGITPQQRGIYRGVICLILGIGAGARDFYTQAPITAKLIKDQEIDDHHVFPDHFLQTKLNITSPKLRECVLNRTLIDRTTNQKISHRGPSDYLAEMRDTPGFSFDSVMSSHSLPTGDGSPFWTDDYESFLNWRQDRLWQEIRRVTGLTDPTDLEFEDPPGSQA
jgi:hypothetical protein